MADKAFITPNVLKWARESARMSEEIAAATVSVTIDKLKEWEEGITQPTIRQAQTLAKAYKRPFALFFLPEVPTDFQPPQDFGTPEPKELTPAPEDYTYLERCFELAEEAYLAGDKPFGSVLVDTEGKIIAEARNRVNERNVLAHPEYELAKWAVENLSSDERRQTKIYTSGEHCPMCAGAHAWAGLGDLIFLSSAEQLAGWLKEWGQTESPIKLTPTRNIINHITIKGPGEGSLLERIKELQLKSFRRELERKK